jgi:hypothetical protein
LTCFSCEFKFRDYWINQRAGEAAKLMRAFTVHAAL